MRSPRVLTEFCAQLNDNDINYMTSTLMDLSFSLVAHAAPVPLLFDQETPTVAPNRPIPHPPPKNKKNDELTRDQRRDVALLHSIGWSYSQISRHLHFQPTKRQIQYACNVRATAQKKECRPPAITQAQVDELVEFVCVSRHNRQTSFALFTEIFDFGIKKNAIRSALAHESFDSRLAMRKPPIPEKNRQIHLAWAIEHRKWTMEQW
ncbi:hypothetical protein GcM3_027041 [Golovinomyces cichoracearum]|uniref:Transposase Tc1-like domain-containing protein n=1 Tax=Golovinomyces cichoracearum TaxID=62708 RepID=A0A420J5R8_9PEZI|nr:hypothetical protein GcM3_027041 [Golovinomyces cichoracearum]